MQNTNTTKTRKKNCGPTNKKGQKGVKSYAERDSANSKQADKFATTEPGSNDVAWYAYNDQLLRDVASLPYSYMAGSRVVVGTGEIPVPGIMKLNFTPTFGISKDASSAINMASRNIYTFVRHQNSGSYNYEAADLMLYLMGIDSAAMYWRWMQRVYGVISLYSYTNRYLPKALLEAMGVSDTIITQIADLRAYINTYAAKLASFAVPANMPIFNRHNQIVGDLYVDSDSPKAQIYFLHPNGFHKYNETDGAGRLDFKVLPSGLTLTTIKNFGDDLLNALTLSEDINIMSGDILKAYGKTGIITYTTIPDGYVVEPKYDKEMLMQIHNAVAVGSIEGEDLEQDPSTGDLLFQPIVTPGATVYNAPRGEQLLDMPWNDPTPADTMAGTRLISICTLDDVYYVSDCGSEIVTNFVVYYYMTSATTGARTLQSHSFTSLMDDSSTALPDYLILSLLSKFDWAPKVEVAVTNADSTKFTYYFNDMNNYTVITPETLRNMNNVATLSLFNLKPVAFV